jgi:hypothetical protein
MKIKDKITIGFCDPGKVSSLFMMSLIQISRNRSEIVNNFLRIEASTLISKSRNRMVKTFLDDTTDQWLLMLDADEYISVTDFDKLLKSADEVSKPIVAGLYFGDFAANADLTPFMVPLIYKLEGNAFKPIYDYPKNSVFEVDAAGTGCLLIHRSVLVKMRESATPNQGTEWCWFWDGAISGRWYGEDLLFCHAAKGLGYPIYVNTNVVLEHHKSVWLKESQYETWRFDIQKKV